MKIQLSKTRKFLGILQNVRLTQAMIKGCAAATEHQNVLRYLPIYFLIDIGANRGQFALIARKNFPTIPIYSFEPLSEPAQIFKHVFANDPNTHLIECAIGRQKSTNTIHITRDDDSSSLLPITATQSGLFPGSQEKTTRQVQVLPLEEALGGVEIPQNSLMKIDVQGYELEVLQGCEDLLEKFTYLYIECSYIELYQGQALAHQVIDWLSQRNFILKGVYNTYYDKSGLAIQSDLLFARPN
jgi:FkbM family methyltransferase